MYSDDSTFQLVPVWQNELQANAYENNLKVRGSHYSYELRNNKLRIYPAPKDGIAPNSMWVKFRLPEENYDEEGDRKYGADGIILELKE